MVIFRILGGLALAGIGFLFVWKSDKMLEAIGAIPWAEDKFGPGGTRLFWKLFGIVVILIGYMMATGLLGGFLIGTVGRLFAPLPQ